MTKWQKVKLGDVCECLGKGKHPASFSDIKGTYPFIVSGLSEKKCNEYDNDDECFIIGDGGCANIHYVNGKYAASDHTYIFKSKDDRILTKYIYKYLSGNIRILEDGFKGAGIKNISKSYIMSILIPLPPKEEQERIAKELDAVSDLLAKQRQLLTEQDMLIKSVFYDMFIKTNNNFKVLKLEDISELITDGVHAKPVYVEKGIPFISVKNITTGFLSFEDCKYISYQDYVKFCSRCHPTYGDILYTKVGATYGRAALVDVNADFSLYVSVALIKPKGNMVNSVFLKHMMNSENIKRQADKSIKGIGVPDLHLIEIKNFIVFVPPLSLQQKFADIVEQIETQKQKIKLAISETETLFNALMAKYFDEE